MYHCVKSIVIYLFHFWIGKEDYGTLPPFLLNQFIPFFSFLFFIHSPVLIDSHFYSTARTWYLCSSVGCLRRPNPAVGSLRHFIRCTIQNQILWQLLRLTRSSKGRLYIYTHTSRPTLGSRSSRTFLDSSFNCSRSHCMRSDCRVNLGDSSLLNRTRSSNTGE